MEKEKEALWDKGEKIESTQSVGSSEKKTPHKTPKNKTKQNWKENVAERDDVRNKHC